MQCLQGVQQHCHSVGHLTICRQRKRTGWCTGLPARPHCFQLAGINATALQCGQLEGGHNFIKGVFSGV